MWKRSKEEITLTKTEIINFMQYLIATRSSLEDLQSFQEQDASLDELNFAKGKVLLSYAETNRLNVQIQTSIRILHLKSMDDFSSMPNQPASTEFEFESSEEDEFYEENTSDDSDVSDDMILNSETSETSDDLSISSDGSIDDSD